MLAQRTALHTWCNPEALTRWKPSLDSRADFLTQSSWNLCLLHVQDQEVKKGDGGICYTWKLVLFLGVTFGCGAVIQPLFVWADLAGGRPKSGLPD